MTVLSHHRCVSGLLFPRPFFDCLARTFQHRTAQRLRRRSIKSKYEDEQVIWSILKDFCFFFVCFCGRASPARHGPGGKATPDCLPVSISSRCFTFNFDKLICNQECFSGSFVSAAFLRQPGTDRIARRNRTLSQHRDKRCE
jgi:hypothetical protein